jgi:replicative DNA helicase
MEETELRLEEQDLRLLKTILTDPLSGVEFANTYDEKLFLGDARWFAKSALAYIKAYRSLPTRRVMLEHFKDDAQKKDIVATVWDSALAADASLSEFKYDLDKIKNRFGETKRQRLKEILDTDLELESLLKLVKEEVGTIERVKKGQKQIFTQKTLKSYMPEFKQSYNDKYHNKDLGRGILTGYSFLDYVKNGMMPSEMLIIGGETGAGKSMLLNNMAIQMWMQQNTVFTDPGHYSKGCNVLYFSLEMPYEACARRSLARLADVPMYGIRDSSLTKFQLQGLNKVSEFITKYPYEFEIVDIPRGVTVDQIEARFQEACSRYHPDVVVVDYLGLLEDSDAEGDDWLKLGYIAGKLHELARVYNIVMLTAVQLNRSSNKSKQDPSELIGIHRIGRSSLIMHHANIGIQIESRKDEHTFSDMRYHVIKNRDGELGMHVLMKNFANASVKDMDPPFEPKKDEFGSVLSGEDVEDISELLKQHNWGRRLN